MAEKVDRAARRRRIAEMIQKTFETLAVDQAVLERKVIEAKQYGNMVPGKVVFGEPMLQSTAEALAIVIDEEFGDDDDENGGNEPTILDV